jgi:hypothetical protein
MSINPVTLNCSKLSIEQLQQYRANAWVTCCMSLGHEKANQNHDLANRYARELTKRGETLDESIEGERNGEGSW